MSRQSTKPTPEQLREFERRKLELLRPLLIEAGAALLDCQIFENALAMMLWHFSRMGVAPLDPDAMGRILDHQDKKTAGQLIKLLKQHAKVSDGIEVALAEGLTARNYLIHRLFADKPEMMTRADDRAELVKEIRKLRRKVRDADKILSPFVDGLIEALDGLDVEKFRADARAQFT